MKILGIDHGTRTGYALLDNCELTKYGSVNIRGDLLGKKLIDFTNKMKIIINYSKPDLIVLEKPNHRRNTKTTILLDGYYCVLNILAAEKKIDVMSVHPTSMKKVITGTGKASKDDVVQRIADNFNLKLKDILEYEYYSVNTSNFKKGDVKKIHYDISDAIGLAYYGYLKTFTNKERGNH